MKDFYQKTTENTIPLLLYLIASFSSVFVSSLIFITILFLLFILVSALLFNRKTLKRILLIAFSIVLLITILSLLFSLKFNFKQILLILPKSISFSMVISSAIAFFLFLPTFQLFRISKTISKNNKPAYAILAGFRTFPLFFEFSKKIFIAIKIRKAYSSYFDFLLLYIQNIFVEFLIFLDNFLNRFLFLNLQKFIHKKVFNFKSYILVVYLIVSIVFIIYEKI